MQPEEVAGTTSLKVRQVRSEAEGRSKAYQHDQRGRKEKQDQDKTKQNMTKSGSVRSGRIKTVYILVENKNCFSVFLPFLFVPFSYRFSFPFRTVFAPFLYTVFLPFLFVPAPVIRVKLHIGTVLFYRFYLYRMCTPRTVFIPFLLSRPGETKTIEKLYFRFFSN